MPQIMTKKFIQDLIKDMSLEEKLGQMTQLTPEFLGAVGGYDLTGPLTVINLKRDCLKYLGSTLNCSDAAVNIRMQQENLKNQPHQIPLMFMADVIHGFKTAFPIPLAVGCSFNPEMAELAAEVAAKESSASGISLTFAPMADLVRDPRWGRVMESPGEDPYLNAVMTAATVRGFQGKNPKDAGRIASCVKHFAAYGAGEGGRDYNTVDMSEGILREFYLPAYKACLDAGAMMVMTSFNTVDRVPASANKKLFRTILRKEWGFNGVVITDFNAIDEVITHRIAANGKEAAKLCLEAGIDIEMISTHYFNYVQELIDEGTISETLIDEATTRVLELKDALGLFENPYKDASVENEKKFHRCKEHIEAALEVARQSIVLLKNEEVLPLKNNIKLGLAGPFAGETDTSGGWAMSSKGDTVNLADGLKLALPNAQIISAMTDNLLSLQEGVSDVPDHVEFACDKLKDCDVIIAAVGESPDDTGEGASKTNLRLSPNQEKMIIQLKKLGKPVVVIVFSGRPLEIRPILSSADAVIQAWFLGSQSGNALAEVLLGQYNPSGRLSMSFPQTVGQIPVYYNAYLTGRPCTGGNNRYVSRYLDCPNEPLYCFGYGLSYSNFVYSDFAVHQGDKIIAEITVENTSDIAGKETVQLYIGDVAASVVRPQKELKAFKQIVLAPAQKETVRFEIAKELLMFFNAQSKFVFESGEFDIMIGKNSSNVETCRIKIDFGTWCVPDSSEV